MVPYHPFFMPCQFLFLFHDPLAGKRIIAKFPCVNDLPVIWQKYYDN